MTHLFRSGMCGLLVAAWLGWGADQAAGQQMNGGSSRTTSIEILTDTSALTLPIDSVAQGLVLLPGIEQTDAGLLVIRQGPINGQAVYLDGVPVSPGMRSSGYLFRLGTSLRLVSLDPALRLGTNAIRQATVTTGAYEAAYGNAESGIVNVSSRTPTGAVSGAIRYQTDELMGSGNGTGTNRILADVGGSITDRLRFYAAAVLDGRQSADNGPGSNQIPLFVPGASDTTMGIPSVIGDPLADTTYVSVTQFPVSRGECDSFAGSTNPDMADNYGFECTGIRIPASAQSGYQFFGSLAFDPVPQGSLVFSATANQDQTRLFDYTNLTNGVQLEAHRVTNSALTASYRHSLGTTQTGWDFFAALSYQHDLAESGPLTTAGEAATRYPTGGFMINPLDLLFDFDAFPVNDRLIENFRDNIPGSRRGPYDLEQTDQYRPSSPFRNDPSATESFGATGGPTGRMGLFQESRKLAVASATWRPNSNNQVTLGGEYTAYSVTNYSSGLTTQVGADAFIETPKRSALYLQDRYNNGRFTLVGGLRLDTFKSGAERPFLLDLTPSSTTFDQYVFFPRTSSYSGTAPDGRPLTIFEPDPAYTVLTPHFQFGFDPSANTSLWASAGIQAQAPDFYQLYTGVNTDLSITSTGQPFSTDQGFSLVNIADLGARHRFSSKLTLEASLYYKDYTDASQARLQNLFDPLNGRPQYLLLYRSDGERTVQGLDLKADVNLGQVFSGWIGYSYAKAETADGLNPSATRPQSLAGALSLALPDDWRAGTTAGAIGRNVGAYAIFRFTSGQPYTRCPAESGNEFVLSGWPCSRQLEGLPNSYRLPTVKQLDLRLTKGFAVSSTFVNVFLDVRNLLNLGNTHTVYAVTGTTVNDGAVELVTQNVLNSWEREGVANGAWLPNGDLMLPPSGACGDWVTWGFSAAGPNCIYLIRAEQRYGNGDGIFDLAEQTQAIEGIYQVRWGSPNFNDPPRRVRIGLEWRF